MVKVVGQRCIDCACPEEFGVISVQYQSAVSVQERLVMGSCDGGLVDSQTHGQSEQRKIEEPGHS